uniref:lipopolysaccharide heptosyltransferase II n=1 Tax=Magnetococcus massalia (strain MO-1) TaxID=451514 RepID=A0A1S7LG53_MAGMO|nr:GT9 : ADP-heptose:LPS heptosyltransferase II [Candidatus Magnetococcus massalia]
MIVKSPPPQTAPLLIIGPAWVGDMVMVSAMTAQLHRAAPQRRIDILCPKWTHPIAQRLPHVGRVWQQPLGHGALGLKTRWQLGKQLAHEGYGQAITLPRSWKSALPPLAARIPIRTSFLGELRYGLLNDIRPLDKQALPRTVDRFMALATPRGEPFSPPQWPALTMQSDPAQGQLFLAQQQADIDRPWAALCPGAEYGPAKQWPAHHMAATARRVVEAGWGVMLLGGPGDRELCQQIVQQADVAQPNQLLQLAGQTTLEQAVDLLAVSDFVLSNDSGLMHVAAALDRPLLALYGSSDPRHTPPLNPTSQTIWKQLPCSPCFKRSCPEQHLQCLEEIDPDEVIARWQLMQPPGGPHAS